MTVPFCMFERLKVLVARGGIAVGECAEVHRVFGDGSVELEIVECDDPPTQMIFGLLANKPLYTRRVSARFMPAEVVRA